MFVASSCNSDLTSDQISDHENDDHLHSRTSPIAPSMLPESIFKFNSLGTFEAYYEMLDELYTADLDAFYAQVAGDGGISFTVHARLMADEFIDSTDMYNPMLADPILSAICNEYYEFVIGDHRFTMINNSQFLMSQYSDNVVRDPIRAIPKGQV